MRSGRRDNFCCSSVFLEAGLSNWGRRNRIRTLEWLGEENKQTNKQTNKKSAAEQMCMDNIPMDLNESDDSSVSDSTEESMKKSLLSLSSSQIFTEPFSSLDSIFLPAGYDRHNFIREANFRFFTLRCIFNRSSLFSLFKLVQGVFRGPCLLIT